MNITLEVSPQAESYLARLTSAQRLAVELGMIKQGETFVQVIEKQPHESASSVPATRTVTPGKR